MAPIHLWRGDWIDDRELTDRLPNLAATLAEDCQQPLDPPRLYRAGAALAVELAQHGPLYRALTDELTQTGDAPDDGAATLATLAEFLRAETLEYQVLRAFGDPAPFTLRRIDYADHRFEAWAPLGVLGHVTPANARGVAAMSLIEGLLAGNINLLKTSRRDGLFTQKLLRALVEREPTLKPFVYVLRLSSRQPEVLSALFALCDGVAVWGGEDAVAAVRAMTPPAARLIEWGHRISFAYVARESSADPAALRALAHDVCCIEQQACSSPQCLYLETADPAELHAFAERFAAVLAEVAPTIPRGQPPGPHEQAEITTTRELCRLDGAIDGSRVIEAPDRSWRLLVEPKPGLRASPLFRTLWIKPLPMAAIVATLRPLRAWLQTAGLACPLERLAELSRALLAAGVTRIVRPGEQVGGYFGGPHDGVYSLQRYARRVALELPASLQGITSFAELEAPPLLPADAAAAPVMDKAGFLALPTDAAAAQLYFKSGGSSGDPKVSVFSHADYARQMRAAGDGLYAAGLDPVHDRCMNLFFAGHLYGGFISFWSALEHLQAVQLPMTAIDDLAEVAAIIERFQVDTLLGMPFYLVKLFHEQGERLRRYGGVRKIFYGGEHFPPVERARLHRAFGVAIIRSAAYGSNDAGPMGYQCPHCAGGVHHLLSTQHLEILALDADRPVAADEVGRLVVTPLARTAQAIRRYETGDLGRWVAGPCPCGRRAPRFELLGRHGDIFRAPYFFSYATFAAILAEQAGYDGEIQIVLTQGEGRSRITLRLSDRTALEASQARELVLAHYHDLREFVVERGLTEFSVERSPLAQFATTPTSGKLQHVVDLRQERPS
ncbi:MAG: acyl-CoA reductase [Candidatus Contendobacter sp.]|nr:acyl-CoA reductase [Candidatus Contendobacter sp.]MDS4057034.1 acyl-CoA reductase [Candidatus Contendobacter sp.]